MKPWRWVYSPCLLPLSLPLLSQHCHLIGRLSNFSPSVCDKRKGEGKGRLMQINVLFLAEDQQLRGFFFQAVN